MKNTLKILTVVLALAASSGVAWSAGVSLTLKGGYFFPTDSVFRDVYKGGLSFGADLAVPIAGPLHLWAGAEIFNKTGFLTISEEETKGRIIPIYAGLRLQFGKKSVNPYLGAAAAYFLFKEENPIGTISDNGLGWLGEMGLLVRLSDLVWIDIFGDYRARTMSVEDEEGPFEGKLDGVTAGLGLSFRF
jgi:hypothetical protein